jgi:hypothetical protein
VEWTLYSSGGKIMPSLNILLEEWYYILMLGTVMTLSYYARKYDVFQPFYSFIAKIVKSKRAVIALTSAISGVLPINGRVVISAGVLNTMAPQDDRRKKYGVIDYLATHHFYFWSPLEKTVILPMAALNISYASFVGSVWPLLATLIICVLYYIFVVVKEDDVDIVIRNQREKHTLDTKKIIKENIVTLAIVTGLLMAGNFVGYHKEYFSQIVDSAHKSGLLILVLLGSFVLSLILGSSGKFAGVLSISLPIFGAASLPILFAANWAGYILSPMHKCMIIGKRMFGSTFKDYYTVLAGVVFFVFLVAVVQTYTTGL